MCERADHACSRTAAAFAAIVFDGVRHVAYAAQRAERNRIEARLLLAQFRE
jgi:hypothetical protein